MNKNIIIQQRDERDFLLKGPWYERIDEGRRKELLGTSLIKLITGPRRAGKSVFGLQLLVNRNFAYANFDDNQLLAQFDEDSFLTIVHEVFTGFEFLFLDEIQNLPGWELFVNKLYRRGYNLVLTGSNARLLSRELATVLTGRFIRIEVFPFNFPEFLGITGFNVSDGHIDGLSPRHKGHLLNHLNTWLWEGGYPECIGNPLISRNYLSSLFDSVILKDIIKRFKIRNPQQAYDLGGWFLANCTNSFTYNSLAADLGFSSVATVQKYAGYLEESYLFFYLPQYQVKIKEQNKSPRKIYLVDNGLAKAVSFELSPNYGRLLENAVCIELIRRGYRPGLELFYYRTRTGKEVDFICRKGYKTEVLVQVCHDPSHPKILKREISALTEAWHDFDNPGLMIITHNEEKTINAGGRDVRMIPAWRWFVERRQ